MRSSFLTLSLILGLAASAAGQGWQLHTVDDGVKPALAVTSDGTPHISYMLEATNGYVRHAVWNDAAQAFDVLPVSTGYFYGPLGMALDALGRPHIVYHDHTLEDQVHAYLTDTGFRIEPIPDDGHDGWDNAVVVDRQGVVHTSSVDPSSFGGRGVEYARSAGSTWVVQGVGSGPIMYANATSLALDASGNPHIAYFDDRTRDLMLAERRNGVWTITPVDTAGDVGRFASLRIDAADAAHLSYYRAVAVGTGLVEYAVQNGAAWTFTTVDTLDRVSVSGARNLTSLALDAAGRPHVAYGDAETLRYAAFDGSAWTREVVLDVSGTGAQLGQLASLALDAQGRPHVATYEAMSLSSPRSVVLYATRSQSTAAEPTPVPELAEPALENYPNPFRGLTRLVYTVPEPARVTLEVFDVRGRVADVPFDAWRGRGRYEVDLDVRGWPAGVYVARLRVGTRTQMRGLLVVR